MIKDITLNGRKVGIGHPCYIIAEVGSNHNRDLSTAKKMIEVSKDAGCDAVKFQSYTAEGLYSIYTPRISEMNGRSHEGETPYELIKRVQMPVEWHGELKAHCDRVGITFCSTPFDETMVDVLEGVGISFYKIASYEITHYPMLRKIALLGKPVILSTGNSGMEDIVLAVRTLKDGGCREIALLHCVSQYPAKYEDMNLRCIETLRKEFDCPVGLSDHTMDEVSVVAGVALGICILEKHITLDRKTFGPDHPFSLEPEELCRLVRSVRATECALGTGEKVVRPSEEENHRLARRSIIAARDLVEGDVINEMNVVIKRPAMGIHPRFLSEILGKKVNKNIPSDYWICQEDLVE